MYLRSRSQWPVTLGGATVLVALIMVSPCGAGPTKPPFEAPPVTPPSFPDKRYDIRDAGAIPGDKASTTQAIAASILRCASGGGGLVVVPKGEWATGPIRLRSHVNLHLSEGAVLRFSTDPGDYLPPVFVRWAGFECWNYSPLIYARSCENIAVTGKGVLDGQGRAWWNWVKDQDRVANQIYDLVLRGIPPIERRFGRTQDPLRPQFIHPVGCRNVWIEGITILEGPFWTVQATYCDGVLIQGIRVINSGPNNDGANVDSSRNVLIEDCFFSTGDDAIAIKSGLNEDGWRVGRPSENIEIRNCEFGSAHGAVAIGSEMSGDVRNVYVHDCKVDGAQRGFWIKSTRGRGGIVENVLYQDIQMRHLQEHAVRFTTDYKAWFGSDSGLAPTIRNVTVRNLDCRGVWQPLLVKGLRERPIRGITFDNISITGIRGVQLSHAEDIQFNTLDLETFTNDPVIEIENCQDITIREATAAPRTASYLKVKGEKSANIHLVNCHIENATQGISVDDPVPSTAVIVE